jgi:hypothetical protein
MSATVQVGDTSQPGRVTSPFVALLRIELGRAFGPRHAVALAAMALMGCGLAFWLPTFPASIYRFFQRVFDLTGWAEIVVANDLAGLFFFAYWIAVFDVLAIYIVPLEERHLDVFLSKPLTRRAYMLARLIPILLTVVGIYTLSIISHWVALRMAGLPYAPGAFIGAAAAVLAWTLLLVTIVNFAILSARETYVALLIAFIPITLSIVPSMIYMYRPDVFAEAPLVRAVVVFPMNLVWYPDFATRWGLPLAGLFLGFALAFAAASGWRIEQRDVV